MAPALFEPLALLPVGSLIALKSTMERNRADSQLPTPAPISQSHPSRNLRSFGSLFRDWNFLKTPPFSFSLSLSAYLQIGHTHKVQGS